MRISFRFRLIPFIATAIIVAIGISLAQWQTRRAEEKIALEAMLRTRQSAPAIRLDNTPSDVEQAEYRRVAVRGEFLRNWPIYLDNRPHEGVAGFYLLMPFKIAATNMHVLVARGWIPRNPNDRSKMPSINTPQGVIEIEGILRRDTGHVMQLGSLDAPQPNAIVQNLDVATFSNASGLKTLPLVIDQTSDAHDGLVRDWPLPSAGVERHRGYAFQWYALAAMAFVFFVVTGCRRGTR
jgi:cytochrome oxidase assembly protein ShyY1